MATAQVIVIAAMIGAVAAGVTWFGWELVQNAAVSMRTAAAKRKAAAEEAERKKREALEAEVRSEAEGQG